MFTREEIDLLLVVLEDAAEDLNSDPRYKERGESQLEADILRLNLLGQKIRDTFSDVD